MNSLKSLGQIYTVIIWVFIIILFGFLIYRIYKVFVKKTERHSLLHGKDVWYSKTLKILFGLSMLLTIIYAPFYVFIGSTFRAIIPNFLNNLLVTTTICLAGLELFLAFSISKKLKEKTYKKIILTIIVVIMLPLSIYLTIYIPAMFTYPAANESITIELPVSGKWMAKHAGSSELVNYHCAYKAQMYDIDIVKINDDREFFTAAGNQLLDYYTMGASIFSPVDGTIINIVDSLPNADITFMPMDTINPAGNHVVIEFEPDRYIFLAHLDKQSVKVNIGDQVNTGDLIGKAGNSGNTSWPHLHLHIQDKQIIDNKNAIGFPFRFNVIKRKRWLNWTTVTNDFLIRNDIFQGRNEKIE
jgi:hypothetical protein